jgi:hypothetical protein
MNFPENNEAYKAATKDLSLDERKGFDNFLLGALLTSCNTVEFKGCLETASRCFANYFQGKTNER